MKGDVGKRVKRLREAKGLTQKQLGKLSGVTGSAIKELESGRSAGSRVLHKIATALGSTPDELETGRPGKAPAPGSFDTDLLEYFIAQLEIVLEDADGDYPPPAKAKILAGLYGLYAGSGERPGRAVILQLVRRAA